MYGELFPSAFKAVGVAEPNTERRNRFMKRFSIEEDRYMLYGSGLEGFYHDIGYRILLGRNLSSF